MMSYDDFLDALGERESGSAGYAAVNRYGYLGKYQMGEAVLTDLGYYTGDGTAANDWQAGHWTGKDGIRSQADFLADHAVQETAVRAEMALKWRALDTVSQYAGQTLDGVKLTVSGLLAGAHLVGQGSEINYIRSGGDAVPQDGNMLPVVSYIEQFAGYATPFTVEHAKDDVLTGGSGDDVLRGFGGDDSLDGGGGRNTLTGGRGSDSFLLGTAPDAGDLITDFHSAAGTGAVGQRDRMVIDTAVLGGRAGEAGLFLSGDRLPPETQRGVQTIRYDRHSGSVYYDPDGRGGRAATLIATLVDPAVVLQRSDFDFI